MSSPDPEVLTMSEKEDEPPTKSQVEDMYKSSYKKYIDGFSIHNDKVRYYCNKTLSMRQPLNEILDDLVNVQYNVMAYLPQDPESLDQFALSMVFTLISKTASLIEWKTLNHDCFWKDFCRETRVLRQLTDQAQISTFECMHTVVDKANRAMEILRDVVPLGKKIADVRLRSTLVQSSGDPSADGIKVIWMEPRGTVLIQWIDSTENNVHSVKLQQTCDSFKLRFLRCLIFHARKSLEQISLAMLRIDLILRYEFQLEKLAKCGGLLDSQLMPHERAPLCKSKRQFDGIWDDIMCTVSRFKFQLDQLGKLKEGFKRQVKSVKSAILMAPNVESISILMEDPLLLKIVSQAISIEVLQESYDFTMYSDRTEDIVAIIQDIWIIDKTNFRKADMLLILVYSALSQIHEVLNKSEQKMFRNNIFEILVQRSRVKRNLKKAMGVFKHKAFQEVTALTTNKSSKSSSTFGRSQAEVSMLSGDDSEAESEYGANETPLLWVELQGGFRVTIGEHKEFLVMNQFRGLNQFGHLDEEQRVTLTSKMVNRLLHFVSVESCQARIMCGRAFETKSLLKRLKSKDRTIDTVVSSVAHGTTYIRQVLKLLKTIDNLKYIAKRFS